MRNADRFFRCAAWTAQGKTVACYISAGTYESNRPDSSKLSGTTSKKMKGWDEKYAVIVLESRAFLF